jgi:hypothetical protein
MSTRRKIHAWEIKVGGYPGCTHWRDETHKETSGVITFWLDQTGAATAALLGIPRPASMKGAIHVTGGGGGKLIFRPDGRVWAGWNEVAAIASAHGSGRRSARVTEAAGNRERPEYSERFELVSFVRRVGRQGFDFPEDHEGPEVLKRLELFQKLAWRMVRAVGTGDAAELRAVADMVEAADKLHSGELVTPLNPWRNYAAAIAQTAEEANGIPKRRDVVRALEKSLPANEQKEDYREDLARMGFGWIPAPSGKPSKGKG